MSDQSSIQFVPVSPVSHREDPHTSTLSAREVTRGGARKRQADEVLRLVRKFPNCTSSELDRLHFMREKGEWRLDRYVIARRLPELADIKNGALVERGPARQCRVTGRMALTWRVRGEGE